MESLWGLVQSARRLLELGEPDDECLEEVVIERFWEGHPNPKASRTWKILASEGTWNDLTVEAILSDLEHCRDDIVLKADIPILEDTGYFRYTEDSWHVATKYNEYRGLEAQELLEELEESDTSDVVLAPIESWPFG
jgi:hypothetical protein